MPAGAEGHRRFVPVRQGQDAAHLIFAVHPHHQLGNQAVQAGVGAVSECAQRIADQACRRDELL